MAGWLDKITGNEKPGLLIVDDDDKLRAFVRASLSHLDLGPVYEAPDGESAIEISYEHSPKIVILDFEMPRMNGQAVARVVRLISPGARIILLTAVLNESPDWVDAYLEKADIDSLPEIVQDQWTRIAIA
jgi:DNA-binding response OmpR family regulator